MNHVTCAADRAACPDQDLAGSKAGVAQSLAGQSLLISGCTGFLGKVVLEKLLRLCPDVGPVFVLIRCTAQGSERRRQASTRLWQEVIASRAFDRLRAEWCEQFESRMAARLVPVPCDLAVDGLGLEPLDLQALHERVDAVVHCAASVVFDEAVDTALATNTLGALRMLRLAQGCRDAVFVHVSTAYVNGQRQGDIAEAPIPPAASIAHLRGDHGLGDYDVDREVTALQRFIDAHAGQRQALVEHGMRRARALGWHDTYTFTKAMGEQLIDRYRGTLAVAVLRPSIIESSLAEPEPGWIEGLNAADPLFVHYGKGRLREFPLDPDAIVDIVPVDVVANAVLCALPALRRQRESMWLQVVSGAANPLRARRLFELVHEAFVRQPFTDRQGQALEVARWRFPSPERFRRSLLWGSAWPLRVARAALHCLPQTRLVRGQRRRVLLQIERVDSALVLARLYEPYLRLRCRFGDLARQQLQGGLSEPDRHTFSLDVAGIDWADYIQRVHLPGLRRHVLRG